MSNIFFILSIFTDHEIYTRVNSSQLIKHVQTTEVRPLEKAYAPNARPEVSRCQHVEKRIELLVMTEK